MVLDQQLVELLDPVLAFGGDVLVRRALVSPVAVAPDEPHDRGVERARLAQEVRIRGQLTERRALHDGHVRVDEQEEVGGASRELHQLGPVVPEVDPRPLVQLARQPAERGPDQVRGAVGRAGVADHPRVDQRQDRSQAALDYRRLVADDHRERDRLVRPACLEVPDHRALTPAGTRGGGDSSWRLCRRSRSRIDSG